MRYLAEFDAKTWEPRGIWSFEATGRPELVYADDRALAEARVAYDMKPEGWVERATTDDWLEFADYLTLRSPYTTSWEFVDTERAPQTELEQLRRRWAGTRAATTSDRFAAAARRVRFHRRHGQRLAEQVLGTTARLFDADRRISTTVSLWVSPDDERLAVIVGDGESAIDVDKALAYGLTFQGDRDLHVVVPDTTVETKGLGDLPAALATLHRAAHVATPVFVWVHSVVDEPTSAITDLGAAPTARPQIVPPPHAVRTATRLDDELKVGEHDLAERSTWIEPLIILAESELGLDASPRNSYLAWHHRGRQVLSAKRTRRGVRLTAGTNYGGHRTDKTPPTVIDLAGPPSSSDMTALRSAITRSIAERDAGTDGENLEHLLQARLSTEGVDELGLVGRLEREVPATRPSQRRAYIDLLGVDERGDLHVIETKLEPDAMLGLQGLDYWVWATEHRDDLVTLLRARGHEVRDRPTIHLDLVIGTKDNSGQPDLRYLAPQLEALDGSVPWRIGVVTGWLGPDDTPHIAWARRRSFPAGGQPTAPRFTHRLHDHLLAHHAAAGSEVEPPFLSDVEAALPATARFAFHRMKATGELHRFFDHVRSSQQFALALFGTLHGDALVSVAQAIKPEITSVSRLDLEFVDPADRLGEGSTASPHLTQADVALHATLGDGSRHLVLIEVKLSEDDFGHCSAYLDPTNDRLDGCGQNGFASGPARCFKLANHLRGGRRLYDLHVVAESSDRHAGCAFRTSNNQPMRNVALASALVAAGDFDSASFVLCAHDEHRTLWRRWSEFKELVDSRKVELGELPASHVLRELDPAVAQLLGERYGLDDEADDGRRLRHSIAYAVHVLQRVSGPGGVLEETLERAEDGQIHGLAAEQRRLSQRLMTAAEAVRSARADLAPPLFDDPRSRREPSG